MQLKSFTQFNESPLSIQDFLSKYKTNLDLYMTVDSMYSDKRYPTGIVSYSIKNYLKNNKPILPKDLHSVNVVKPKVKNLLSIENYNKAKLSTDINTIKMIYLDRYIDNTELDFNNWVHSIKFTSPFDLILEVSKRVSNDFTEGNTNSEQWRDVLKLLGYGGVVIDDFYILFGIDIISKYQV